MSHPRPDAYELAEALATSSHALTAHSAVSGPSMSSDPDIATFSIEVNAGTNDPADNERFVVIVIQRPIR